MRYPGPDEKLNTQDDLFTVNDLHFVKNRTVLIQLKSSDVLHSFFLPQFRIKQDAVPGLTTVHQPLHRMGAAAVRRLLDIAAGRPVESGHVRLATRLVIRHSTAPVDPG